VPDPACADEDGGAADAGETSGGGRAGRGGGGRGAGPFGDGGDEAEELEDVGCGCRVVGARVTFTAAPVLLGALAILLGLLGLRRTRRRRRP
jgi:hypothetical protein